MKESIGDSIRKNFNVSKILDTIDIGNGRVMSRKKYEFYHSDVMKSFVCNLLTRHIDEFLYRDYHIDIIERLKRRNTNMVVVFENRNVPYEIYEHMSEEDTYISIIQMEKQNDYISCINNIIVDSYRISFPIDVVGIKETPLTKYVTKKFDIINNKKGEDVDE